MIERSLYRHPFKMAGLIVISAILLGAFIFGVSQSGLLGTGQSNNNQIPAPDSDLMDEVLAQLGHRNQELKSHFAQNPQRPDLSDAPALEKIEVLDFENRLERLRNAFAQKKLDSNTTTTVFEELSQIQSRREEGRLSDSELNEWTSFIQEAVRTPVLENRNIARILFEELQQLGHETLLIELATESSRPLGFRIELLQILPELQSQEARDRAHTLIQELTEKATLAEVLAAMPQAQMIYHQDQASGQDWLIRLQARVCNSTSSAGEQLRWQLMRYFPGHHCEARL